MRYDLVVRIRLDGLAYLKVCGLNVERERPEGHLVAARSDDIGLTSINGDGVPVAAGGRLLEHVDCIAVHDERHRSSPDAEPGARRATSPHAEPQAGHDLSSLMAPGTRRRLRSAVAPALVQRQRIACESIAALGVASGAVTSSGAAGAALDNHRALRRFRSYWAQIPQYARESTCAAQGGLAGPRADLARRASTDRGRLGRAGPARRPATAGSRRGIPRRGSRGRG